MTLAFVTIKDVVIELEGATSMTISAKDQDSAWTLDAL